MGAGGEFAMVRLDDLTVAFRRHPVLHHISGQFASGSLSAGQFQRMLFARLLLQDADLILLDEPFNAIDSKTTAELLRLVAAWHQEGRTVIAVVHDHAQIQRHFPQTLLLARDMIAWGDTATVMTAEHLRQAKAMAEAWDESAPA